MESLPKDIEDLCREKVTLLETLLECVNLERESLIDLNQENLWSLMERKQAVLDDIEIKGRQIKSAMESGKHPEARLPREGREILATLTRKMKDLQEEIRIRVSENVSFIRETLHFFDHLIALLVTSGRPETGYHPGKRGRKDGVSLIYQREV